MIRAEPPILLYTADVSLHAGLTPAGVAHSWVLGTLVYSAFGPGGYFLVCLYFLLGSAVSTCLVTFSLNRACDWKISASLAAFGSCMAPPVVQVWPLSARAQPWDCTPGCCAGNESQIEAETS